jgi:hypothetical protein
MADSLLPMSSRIGWVLAILPPLVASYVSFALHSTKLSWLLTTALLLGGASGAVATTRIGFSHALLAVLAGAIAAALLAFVGWHSAMPGTPGDMGPTSVPIGTIGASITLVRSTLLGTIGCFVGRHIARRRKQEETT